MGTPLQLKRDPFIYVIWIIILVGMGFLFYKGRISWEALTAGTILLGLPSLLMKGREVTERERKTDRPIPPKDVT